MQFDDYCEAVYRLLMAAELPPHSLTRQELRAAYLEYLNPQDVADAFIEHCNDYPCRASNGDDMCEAMYLMSE